MDVPGPVGSFVSRRPVRPRSTGRLESLESDLYHKEQKKGSSEDLEQNAAENVWNRAKSLFFRRLYVMVLLLLLQSLSSFILQAYEPLLEENVEIMLFLTMLIGAGGNASNQSAVRVIRDLAVRKESVLSSSKAIFRLILEETLIGICLAVALAVVGLVRVGIFFYLDGTWKENASSIVLAVNISLILIVIFSVFVGASLPIILYFFKADPAHAGPAVQVIMDISGVFITCVVSSIILGAHKALPKISEASNQ